MRLRLKRLRIRILSLLPPKRMLQNRTLYRILLPQQRRLPKQRQRPPHPPQSAW